MEKRLLKIVIVNIITMVLSVSVYGQDSKKNEEEQSVALNVPAQTKKEIKPSPETMQVKSFAVRKYRVVDLEKKDIFQPKDEYILMIDGKAFENRKGKFMPVKPERTIGSMKVNSKGRVIQKDGTEVMFKKGGVITEEGSVITANEAKILTERLKTMDASYATLVRREWELVETMAVFNEKISLMNKKMDLVNQKMMLLLDQMNTPKMTRRDIKEYMENISALDAAIEDTDYRIKEIEKVMKEGAH